MVYVYNLINDIWKETGSEKKPISGYARRTDGKDDDVIYESEFVIPGDFGGIGAVVVENEHRNEMFLKHIVIDGLPTGSVDFDCRSWVESKFDNPQKRIFFADKVSHHTHIHLLHYVSSSQELIYECLHVIK